MIETARWTLHCTPFAERNISLDVRKRQFAVQIYIVNGQANTPTNISRKCDKHLNHNYFCQWCFYSQNSGKKWLNARFIRFGNVINHYFWKVSWKQKCNSPKYDCLFLQLWSKQSINTISDGKLASEKERKR